MKPRIDPTDGCARMISLGSRSVAGLTEEIDRCPSCGIATVRSVYANVDSGDRDELWIEIRAGDLADIDEQCEMLIVPHRCQHVR